MAHKNEITTFFCIFANRINIFQKYDHEKDSYFSTFPAACGMECSSYQQRRR